MKGVEVGFKPYDHLTSLYFCCPSFHKTWTVPQLFFKKTTIWQTHGQLWAILKGTASQFLSLCLYSFHQKFMQEAHNDVGSLSMAKHLVEFELGTLLILIAVPQPIRWFSPFPKPLCMGNCIMGLNYGWIQSNLTSHNKIQKLQNFKTSSLGKNSLKNSKIL